MADGFAANPREHADWCEQLFFSLAQGGIWAIPRSGLVFERRGRELHLIDRMPWSGELVGIGPPTPEALLAYQDQELALVREHFAEAGIPVKTN